MTKNYDPPLEKNVKYAPDAEIWVQRGRARVNLAQRLLPSRRREKTLYQQLRGV